MPEFRYRNEQLDILHTTSIPRTEDDALDYCPQVVSWYPKDAKEVIYVEQFVEAAPGEFAWKMLSYKYSVPNNEIEDLKC